MTGSTTGAISSVRVRRRPSYIRLVRDGIADLRSRYRLISYLVGADLKRTHADTLFGQLWWIFDPLLQMAVYFILVQVIFQRTTPDFPLFLFAAILPWKWFTTTLSDSTNSVVSRQSLIRQLNFPKIVLPTAAVAAGTMSFVFGLIALAFVYLFYLERLTPWVLVVPLIAFVQFVFTLAMAIGLSAMNAFYRDVQNVLSHALRLWFYLSPVLYQLDKAALGGNHVVHTLLSLNPFSPLLVSYRNVTWGMTAPDWFGLLNVFLGSLVLLALAIGLFKRVEPAFARIL